ncbi:unnamed protein product [Cochlearia groenlandica]
MDVSYPRDTRLGSLGLIKKSEFIRLIIDALISLGFGDIAASLEKDSGFDLHSPIVKEFLELVKQGEWDKSIDALKGFELRDVASVRFLLLEQKFLAFVKIPSVVDALRTLREEMVPLGVNMARCHKLASQLISPSYVNAETMNSMLMKNLRELFPLGDVVPERALEYHLERILFCQRVSYYSRNIPDSQLSLFSQLHNSYYNLPSKALQTLRDHTDEVWFLKFSHNGKYLASSSKDCSAIIWEINAEKNFLLKHKLLGHEKPVVAVLWSLDDRQVITCGENEVIRRWDVESGAFVGLYERNGVGSVSCGWFHDGSGIIGGMADRSIYMWKLDGTQIPHEQEQRAQVLSDVAMTTDGKWLISVGKENEILLFNRETNNVERVIQESDMITSFSLSEDNHLLVDLITQKICLWYIGDREPRKVYEYSGHKRSRFIIRSCLGGCREAFVASGSEDSQVCIWKRHGPEVPFRVLQGHSGAVNCVSWNPTHTHMLASATASAEAAAMNAVAVTTGKALATADHGTVMVGPTHALEVMTL